MFIFRLEFWTSKSESLAQDLVGAFIKTVLVAAMAFVVMEYVKHTLEVHSKRRALIDFQNSTVEGVIKDLQADYAENLSCTASVARFEDESCVTGLRTLRVTLDLQAELVSGILNKDLDAFRTLGSTMDTLIGAHNSDLTSDALSELLAPTQMALRSAINDLAQEIRLGVTGSSGVYCSG